MFSYPIANPLKLFF